MKTKTGSNRCTLKGLSNRLSQDGKWVELVWDEGTADVALKSVCYTAITSRKVVVISVPARKISVSEVMEKAASILAAIPPQKLDGTRVLLRNIENPAEMEYFIGKEPYPGYGIWLTPNSADAIFILARGIGAKITFGGSTWKVVDMVKVRND